MTMFIGRVGACAVRRVPPLLVLSDVPHRKIIRCEVV
jgi:hypothetical protein